MPWFEPLCETIQSEIATNDPNTIFEQSKGHWKCPAGSGMNMITNPSDHPMLVPADRTTFLAKTSFNVASFFDGEVIAVNHESKGNYYWMMVQYGDYFLTYTGLSNPLLKVGDSVKTGQRIGSVARDPDEGFCLTIFLTKNEHTIKSIDPGPWFERVSLIAGQQDLFAKN